MDYADSIKGSELGELILHMHEGLGMGFRRISKALKARGYTVSKDRANRLYWEYRKTGDVHERDKVSIRLTKQKVEALRRYEAAKMKNKTRWHIAELISKEIDEDFELRGKHFRNKAVILGFARKVLRVTYPVAWLKITEFCKSRHVNLAEALHAAIGSQAGYESRRIEYLERNCEYFLDEHLSLRIEDWLLQHQEKESKGELLEKSEVQTQQSSGGIDEYVDEEGFAHITVPYPVEDQDSIC